jgi:hypothetical protein
MKKADTDEFRIDPERLDEEIIRQAQLTRAAGRQEADARHAYNHKKQLVEIIGARLRLAIRNNPGKYGLPAKPNKDSVDDTLLMQDEYSKAVHEMNQAKWELDVFSADSTALLDRRKMIERYVEIMHLNYRSEKGVPHSSDKAVQEKIESRRRHALRGGGITDDDP